MTQTGKDEAHDTGFPFLVVRLLTPPSTALDKLTSEMQVVVQANIERARRIFRSRTLPYPGSDARLFTELLFDVGRLSGEVDRAILEGIHDETALGILRLPEDDDGISNLRVELVQTGKGDDRRFEFQHAGILLGEYWYRHREMDMFDAFKMAKDLEAARERGELGLDILRWSKPPAPTRRAK